MHRPNTKQSPNRQIFARRVLSPTLVGASIYASIAVLYKCHGGRAAILEHGSADLEMRGSAEPGNLTREEEDQDRGHRGHRGGGRGHADARAEHTRGALEE